MIERARWASSPPPLVTVSSKAMSSSDDCHAILSDGRTASPIMLSSRTVRLDLRHPVLPAELSEYALAIFRLSGAEVVLQVEVAWANVVAPAASV